MEKFRKTIIAFSVSVILFVACKDNDVKPSPPTPEHLISSESKFTRSSSELQTYLSLAGINVVAPSQLKYDVELFRVTYKTKYKDQDITASGLVLLPKTSDPVSMISFQHGTISANSEAPSVSPASGFENILYTALASPGFICVVPDYIGFGESKNLLHPYYVEDAMASSIIDLLKAAKELAVEKEINFNGNLFLAGYSEGGYATMATHKAIEANGLEGFTLKASFPAAGGYDVKEMEEHFFSLNTYGQPYYMAYVAMAYRTFYNWTAPLTDLFKEPYASKIPSLFNGELSGGQVNAQLTNSIGDLISDDIRTKINTDPKYKYILDALTENSLTDWVPKIPMYMYHGDADTTVPYSNSVSTYNKLIANGASPSVVSLTTLPGETHSSGIMPYVEMFVPRLLELQNQ
jgi:pimeloyl-ACP methyl ester carboxylesterase